MPKDNSRYHALRESFPTDARMALMHLRKKGVEDPISQNQALDKDWVLKNVKNHGIMIGPFTIVFNVENHGDSLHWHLSVSHKDRYPTWDELMIFRSFIFDDDMEVIMVMPKEGEYVNIHHTCFHMWHDTKSRLMNNAN